MSRDLDPEPIERIASSLDAVAEALPSVVDSLKAIAAAVDGALQAREQLKRSEALSVFDREAAARLRFILQDVQNRMGSIGVLRDRAAQDARGVTTLHAAKEAMMASSSALEDFRASMMRVLNGGG